MIKVKLPEGQEEEQKNSEEIILPLPKEGEGAKEKKVITKTELCLNFHDLYTYIRQKFKITYHESRI